MRSGIVVGLCQRLPLLGPRVYVAGFGDHGLAHRDAPDHTPALSRAYTEISYTGQVVGGFPVLSGIKQGCPLSRTLFALTLDPLTRMYFFTLTLHSSWICAFADDIGLALLNVYEQLACILRIFARWALAIGLTLKVPKCVLIPLFLDVGDLLRWLATLAYFSTMAVQDYGRYLGVEIGPGAHRAHASPHALMNSAFKALRRRPRDIRDEVPFMTHELRPD